MFGKVRAPEIDQPGLRWFNVAAPLGLAALRGKVVLLDFWTFCCINCMHVLPSLRRVEEAFPDEVVVIGVHSPKFAAERDPENVERAIARYSIRHPVVHDPEFRIWQAYAVRAWPTLVFVGPDGMVIGQHSGEPDPERLLVAVARLVGQAHEAGTLAPAPLPFEPASSGAGRLAFPGKMKPLDGGDGWAIADSGHHQIVLVDAGGQERQRFGSGHAGLEDGAAATARFRDPQGLVCGPGAVYVADTGNHALRRIDLGSGQVTTLAGDGRRGPVLPAAPAERLALASPWDLELAGGRLYFANAGTHQIGFLDLTLGTIFRLAGDGGEAIEDGPAAAARLAQPSGLALAADGGTLWFVDSETSAVRGVSLGSEPQVFTLAGTGLFDFGHRNGPLAQALFQHPLGIALDGGRLLVADSYNGRIRVVDPAAGEVSDLDPGDWLCTDPLCQPAGEPAGVAARDGLIFLVDTNNHRILRYQPEARRYGTWLA